MAACNIRQVFELSYGKYCALGHFQSGEQVKASKAILACKTGSLGANVSTCPDCGHTEYHYDSCRNRNCPNCQAVRKELWVDARRSKSSTRPISTWSSHSRMS